MYYGLLQEMMKQLNTIAGLQYEAARNHYQGEEPASFQQHKKGIIPSASHENSGVSRNTPVHTWWKEIGQKLWKQVEEPP